MELHVEFDNITDFALFLGHKKLLLLNFFPEEILDWLGRIVIEYDLSQNLFVLVVFLLVELQEVLFALQIFFELVYLFSVHVFVVLLLNLLVLLDLA